MTNCTNNKEKSALRSIYKENMDTESPESTSKIIPRSGEEGDE